MLALRIWAGLTLLLTTAFDRDSLDEVDSAPRERGIVGTGYAKYRGVETYGDVTSYLGIPYAEPPLGDLRFRVPKPLDVARVSRETGGNVVNATVYPDSCVQGPLSRKCLVVIPSGSTFTGAGAGGDRGGAGTEDCLKVNIYTPSKAKPGNNCESGFVLP